VPELSGCPGQPASPGPSPPFPESLDRLTPRASHLPKKLKVPCTRCDLGMWPK
ncbi:unnamed protein product, partial [Rangifer tarandus platyrhynchus]